MGLKTILRQKIVDKSRILTFLYNNVYLKYVLRKRCKITIRDYGQNNVVDIPVIYSNNLVVTFRGNDNCLRVAEGCNFKMSNTVYFQGDNNVVEIGDNVTFDGNTLIVVGEGTKVRIGSDCVFADRVHIRTTDQHYIFDVNGQRVNHAKDVYIGDHVWLGKEVIIMKGVTIGSGAIVGIDSMVTKDVPERCIAVGKPARVIKSNVYWHE